MKKLTAAIVACTVALNLLCVPAARAGDNFVLPVGVGEGTFKIGEDGNPAGFTFEAEGSASQLGSWTNYGETFIIGPDGNIPGNLKVIGVVTFESAQGDELYGLIDGSLDPATGAAAALFIWNGGTGQYADATGSAEMDLTQTPPDANGNFEFTFTMAGTLVN